MTVTAVSVVRDSLRRSRNHRAATVSFMLSSGSAGGVQWLATGGLLLESPDACWATPLKCLAGLWVGFACTACVVCWHYLSRRRPGRAATVGGLAGVCISVPFMALVRDAALAVGPESPMVLSAAYGGLAGPSVCMLLAILGSVSSRVDGVSAVLEPETSARSLSADWPLASILGYYWICVFASPIVERWASDGPYFSGIFPVMVGMWPVALGFALVLMCSRKLERVAAPGSTILFSWAASAVTLALVLSGKDLLEEQGVLGHVASLVTIGGASALAALQVQSGARWVCARRVS